MILARETVRLSGSVTKIFLYARLAPLVTISATRLLEAIRVGLGPNATWATCLQSVRNVIAIARMIALIARFAMLAESVSLILLVTRS